jgi:hypothetical protein
MASSSNTDSHSLSREGSKWMVSIAGAVVAGAFTQYDKVLLLPVWLKISFLFAIFVFLCITFLGVSQFYWLNRASNQEARVNEPTLTDAERSAASDGLRQAKDQVKNYHYALMGCFAAATLFSAATLFGAVLVGKPENKQGAVNFVDEIAAPAPMPVLGYELVLTAVHQTRHGREAHTLLLNRETGETWQMVCDGVAMIRFQKVHKVDTSTQ